MGNGRVNRNNADTRACCSLETAGKLRDYAPLRDQRQVPSARVPRRQNWQPQRKSPRHPAGIRPGRTCRRRSRASAGSDWLTSYRTQVDRGLGYVRDRYGSPCGAWNHSVSLNWY